MIRATTPTHTFIFSDDPEELFKEILITYAQNGKIILEKHKEDLVVEETVNNKGIRVYSASYRLTQQETKLFSERGQVSVQVRVLTYAGEAMASEKKTVPVHDVLNDVVLV